LKIQNTQYTSLNIGLQDYTILFKAKHLKVNNKEEADWDHFITYHTFIITTIIRLEEKKRKERKKQSF
jgi:hypothetical protein